MSINMWKLLIGSLNRERKATANSHDLHIYFLARRGGIKLLYNMSVVHSEYASPPVLGLILSIIPLTRSYTANTTDWPGATRSMRGVNPL